MNYSCDYNCVPIKVEPELEFFYLFFHRHLILPSLHFCLHVIVTFNSDGLDLSYMYASKCVNSHGSGPLAKI